MELTPTVTVDAGEDDVVVRLTVTNDGDDPLELTFGSGQTAEFVVRTDGETVWRWSDGRLFTQQVRRETIAPGEKLVAEGRWSDPQPGQFTVEATLTAADHRPSASATFER
ncbi:BsuPI-related putative proteinase inhibitor [Halosimplex amylolyticum]|uniref:BsuPI-related putative proteinase inhibitor n=1 Tax=Halosimplex amylolyticum TaxID=3396616 RepID=UPI003F56F0D9